MAEGDAALIALFCNVEVTPKNKTEMAGVALAKGALLDIYDLERLRSLLDSSLKEVRRRYLGLDDDTSQRLRAAVRKLLTFPDAAPSGPEPPSMLERMLVNKLPPKLFALLLEFDEVDVQETPVVGADLQKYLHDYYAFQQQAAQIEHVAIETIGTLVTVKFRQGWKMYWQYAAQRFGGATQDQIVAHGNFLNYEITWEDTERVFGKLSALPIGVEIVALFAQFNGLTRSVEQLRASIEATSRS